jgi:hypothetical protein
MSVTRLAQAVAALVCSFSFACGGADDTPSMAVARAFDQYPLYWVGPRFEQWKLTHADIGQGSISSFIYGTCDPGPDGGCPPPLDIQIQPLCSHLDVAASNPAWRRGRIRGAPLGKNPDGAPIVFTDRVQVKVYRGAGSNPGLAMRALRLLRSANHVGPRLGVEDPIPGARLAVLSGRVPCST